MIAERAHTVSLLEIDLTRELNDLEALGDAEIALAPTPRVCASCLVLMSRERGRIYCSHCERFGCVS